MHIGGDEADFWSGPCWKENKNISDFMAVNFTSHSNMEAG